MTEPDDPKALTSLDKRLEAAQSRQRAEKDRKAGRTSRPGGTGMGFGFRLAMDLLAALLLGVGAGLGLDWWLGTKPLFLILFFFFGGAAGILNAYRAASGMGFAVGYKREQPPEDGDERG
ncbi:MAG: AtpZ/AtpI family protein [Kiloniellales bacterium]|nr:AtpZ/AtpI family protein [Kiloniellales bacterium]